MRRGMLSNVGAWELWVHSDVMFTMVTPPKWKFWAKEKAQLTEGVVEWLWAVAQNFRPVLVWTSPRFEHPELPRLFGRQLVYKTFQAAIDASRVNRRVVEIVVVDPILKADGVVLWDQNPERYMEGRRWTSNGV